MTNLYDDEFLFFAERKTHRAFLCQNTLDAGRLYVAGYPAIAPIDGRWISEYNGIFYMSGHYEIWLLGKSEWIVDTRERCFDVKDRFTYHLIPLAETWKYTTDELVRHAWDSVHPPEPDKPSAPPAVLVSKQSNNHRISRFDIRGRL